ncbi:hypothetical protein ACFY6U_45785 [Streptomyces sp. NPDC013157]|uniref:hypothetical protein n=1 Tax=Streptomyces sp. NPDC013157 TaxID=3364861 RepID=UPI00367E03DC
MMLVGGARHQLDLIHDQCDARGLEVRLLIDFVHVLEYAWGAAWCFFTKTGPATENWIGEMALEILQGRAEQVADDRVSDGPPTRPEGPARTHALRACGQAAAGHAHQPSSPRHHAGAPPAHNRLA